MHEAMRDILGGPIAGIFDRMKIAEEEIAKRDEPRAHLAFAVLAPTEVLTNKAPDVYRAHAAELIDRVVKSEDTRPATKAEALCAMMATATAAPLNQNGGALTEWLFSKVLPGHDLGESLYREQWDGQIAQDFSEIQRKLADSNRTVKP